MDRRKFIHTSAAGSLWIGAGQMATGQSLDTDSLERTPVVISTWDNQSANSAAWDIVQSNGNALDAVETGVRVVEADPSDTSVGFGGLPDREGNVTLDACIMDWEGNCGSVSYLQNIKHPISVARKVMEDTKHVMLSGKGAQAFALSKGFKKENLLTASAKGKWKQWRNDQKHLSVDANNHDTIGMVAIDKQGRIAGACTTSGAAFKLPGRVGDSPIIGAGMFVDNEIGGAVATGTGEEVIRICGTFLIVELMRMGRTPQEACEEAVHRILKRKQPDDLQVGFLAINKAGDHGAYSVREGFEFVLYQDDQNQLLATNYQR